MIPDKLEIIKRELVKLIRYEKDEQKKQTLVKLNVLTEELINEAKFYKIINKTAQELLDE